MSLLSDVSIFAVVLAVNLFLFGALLAGGLAVVLRFTENASPRLRYLVSIAVFLIAIFLPLTTTALKNSAEQKAVVGFVKPEFNQKSENGILEQPNYISIGKAADLDSPPLSKKLNDNLINDFVLTVTNSSAGGVFLSIWILGIFLLSLRQLVGIWRLEQAKRYWTRASKSEHEILDCPKNIPLYYADDQPPGTTGWLRPAIVLPREFPDEISFQTKRFIVRHEISHARWRDPFFRFLLCAVRNLFWISPALWLIERLAYTECEAAADRAAIDDSAENRNSQITALNYAETLLSIARSFKSMERRNRQSQFVGIGAEGDLEIRIRRLLSSCRTTRRQIVLAICACFLTAMTTAVIPVASFSEIAQETKSQNFFSADNQITLPVIKNTDDSAVENNSDFLQQAEIFRDDDEFIRSKISLKKSANENPAVAKKTSISGLSKERDGLSNLNSNDGTDTDAISAKLLSDEDAREAELRENQQAASKLNTLENLSATNNSGESSKQLRSLEPARKSLTTLKTDDDFARQKALSDLDSRRDYSPKLPAPAKPPKPYNIQYIPYKTGQSEP